MDRQALDDGRSPHQQFQTTPNSNNTTSNNNNNMLVSRDQRANQVNNDSLGGNSHTYRSENAKNSGVDGNLAINKNKI